MAARHILYFTGEDHYLYGANGGTLELEAKFSADDLGVGAFREFLRTRRGALFAVLADVPGEDFHEEQIPGLRGGDREAIIARRLASRYRDTRLAAALSMGHVTAAERKNERLLLASFTNTQQFAPWLDALEEAGTRLTGVYSVPLLAPSLAARLGVHGSRVLLVSANRSGLRQCYIENGRLRFARLERAVDMAPQALAMFVRTETHRLMQYLTTLRALPRDGSPVQAVVIAPGGERARFEAELVSDSRLTFRTLDQEEASRALKLRRSPDGAGAEALYAYLLSRKAPREQFASREDRRRYFIWQLQRAIVGAGAAAFLACALVGGSRWWDVLTVRAEATEQADAARSAAQQYERITSTFPVTDTTTENLKVTVVEFQRIAERTASPERALSHVSRVLDKSPQFDLDEIKWSVGKPNELRDATIKPGAAPSASAPAGQAASDTFVVMELSGRVQSTQRNDYRGLTAQVQRFAASLATDGYALVRTQLPFDVTSEGVLSGDMGAKEDSSEAPRFTIVLARRLP
jgi:hypothetical protein